MRSRTAAFSDRILRARAVRIEDEITRRGIKLRGRVERIGPCPRCGGTDRFSINIKKQCFNCRRCGGGDVIVLVQHLDSADFVKAVETLTNRGSRSIPAPIKATALLNKDAGDYERQQHLKAAWLWSHHRPIAGTIAERYLREARAITCRLPPTLGFLPPSKPEHHPAMIAAFALAAETETGTLAEPQNVRSVHLTLLRPDGSGKAEVTRPKITIGSPGGKLIMVAPMNDMMGLAITEGIEDALTVHTATGLGAWAAGSAPFLPNAIAAIEYLATTG